MISYKILTLMPNKISANTLSKYRSNLRTAISDLSIIYTKRSKLRKTENIVVEDYILREEEKHYQTIIFVVDEKQLINFFKELKTLWDKVFYIKFISDNLYVKDRKFTNIYQIEKKRFLPRINNLINNKIEDVKDINLFTFYNTIFAKQYNLIQQIINLLKYILNKS